LQKEVQSQDARNCSIKEICQLTLNKTSNLIQSLPILVILPQQIRIIEEGISKQLLILSAVLNKPCWKTMKEAFLLAIE